MCENKIIFYILIIFFSKNIFIDLSRKLFLIKILIMETHVDVSYGMTRSQTTMMYLRFFSRIIIMAVVVMFNLDLLLDTKLIASIGKSKVLAVTMLILTTLALYFNVVNRNFYLPFLGYSVYPCGSLIEKVPANANVEVKVIVPPNVNVVYWASEPSAPGMEPISNPWDAYANYENAGVVKSDASGVAVLKVRMPSSYRVGLMNRKLDRHVHYRVCKHPGMLSDIKTVMVE